MWFFKLIEIVINISNFFVLSLFNENPEFLRDYNQKKYLKFKS